MNGEETKGRRLRRIIFATGIVVLVGALVYVVVGTVLSNTDEIQQAEIARKQDARVQAAVVDALVTNCELDHRARLQYKRRAVVEQRLARLEAKSNELLAQILNVSLETPDPSATAEELQIGQNGADLFEKIARLEDELAKRIVILPVRKCDELRRRLLKIDGLPD